MIERRELSGEQLVERAADIAREAHDGQEHFFGEGSYFDMHVAQVAEIVRRWGYGALSQAGALLHDVVEDTEVTLHDLRIARIPLVVVDAVGLMTKFDGYDHDTYLHDIKCSPIATVGKTADSTHNFSTTILQSPNISDEHFRSWSLEYAGNISALLPHLPAAHFEQLLS